MFCPGDFHLLLFQRADLISSTLIPTDVCSSMESKSVDISINYEFFLVSKLNSSFLLFILWQGRLYCKWCFLYLSLKTFWLTFNHVVVIEEPNVLRIKCYCNSLSRYLLFRNFFVGNDVKYDFHKQFLGFIFLSSVRFL